MRALELMEKAEPLKKKRCVITTIYDSKYTGILTNVVVNETTYAVVLILLMDNNISKKFYFNKVKNVELLNDVQS